MKRAQRGSSLIVILMSMSIILAACAVLFQSSVFFRALAATRVKEAQAELLLMGLMHYGIAIAKDNYTVLTDKEFGNNTATIALDLHDAAQAQIVLRPSQQGISIQAVYQGKTTGARSATCILSKQEPNQKLLISGFQM